MLGFLAMGLIGIAFATEFLTYMLPGLSGNGAEIVRALMLNAVEVGIGIGGGIIFISIIFSMMKEEESELREDIS